MANFRKQLLSNLVGTLMAASVVAGAQETLEFLTYTPPPGWSVQNNPEGKIFIGKDANGFGHAAIAVYMSRPASGTAMDAFAVHWRTYVEKSMPGPPPVPKPGRDGDFNFAAGSKQAMIGGLATNATLVVFSGRGREFGSFAIAQGDEWNAKVLAFFASFKLGVGAPDSGQAVTSAPSGTGSGNAESGLDFDVPPGYTASRSGRNIVLTPAQTGTQSPCIYGIAPARASRGSLEQDAEAALLEPFPGWQRMDDRRRAMKGTSDAGWPYFWYRADVWQGASAFAERALAMAVAIPAGPGRVHIVWGKGNHVCTFDDSTFVKLFHSLRPRGWTSDGGKALANDLLGTWRWTNGYTSANMLMQYTFKPNGVLIHDIGSTTQLGVSERTSTSTGNGTYALRGSELTVTRARGDSRTYRIRIYDEFSVGTWQRVLSLLDEKTNPPAAVEYYRVNP